MPARRLDRAVLTAPIAGRYRPVEVLGEGSAGRVLRCRDLELDRDVAVKFLGGQGPLSDPRRFREEAQILASLRHPAILEVFDFGLDGDQPFLVTELAEGGTLAARVAAAPLSPAEAVEVARALLDALAHGHAQGVLHRDVKPENVLLSAGGAPKLADFGLAKRAASGVRTHTGIVLGTPEYMAPELFEGVPFSPASDLYAWGCLCFEVVNGAPPYRGSLAELVRQTAAGALPRGREQGGLAAAIRGTVVPDPGRRLPIDELRRLLEGGRARGPATVAAAALPTVALETADVGTGEVGRGAGAPSGAPAAAPGRPARAGAPTRATSVRAGPAQGKPAGTQAATRTSRRGPLTIGVRALASAAAALAAWSLLSPTGPAPPARPPSPSPSEVAAAWTQRIDPREVADLVAQLQGRVDPQDTAVDAEKYQHRMFDHRAGVAVVEATSALETYRPRLPHLAALEAERPALESALRADDLSLEARFELAAALEALGDLDALYTAWGRPAPYRVAGLRAALFTTEVLPPREPGPDAGPGPLPPGPHRVFHWARPQDAAYPCLMPETEVPSEDQKVSWAFARMTAGWDPLDHGEARARVQLADPPPALAVDLTVGQFTHPDSLQLRVNGRVMTIRADLERTTRESYFTDVAPQYRVRVRPPAGVWRPGENQLVVTAHELRGLPHHNGTDVHWIEVVVPPARD